MAIELKDLGLTQEELVERVVEQIAQTCMTQETEESVRQQIQKRIKDDTSAHVESLFNTIVAPSVKQHLETLILQETTKWGEKAGKAMSVTEYLVARCEAYIQEPVDFQGKAKGENNSDYNWRSTQSRLTYLVHQHFQYEISTAVGKAIKIVTEGLGLAIETTVKKQIDAITAKLSVKVEVPR